MPSSRPRPLRLNPPNGVSVRTLLWELTEITPVRSAPVTRMARPTSAGDAEISALLDRYDGLMLLGGGDLSPDRYGQEHSDTIYGVDHDRDATELDLCRGAIRAGMPVLAICRGHQVLNVALGGTLDQHITDRAGLVGHGIPGVEDGAQPHDVEVEPQSRLATAMGTTHACVSSHHHQAVEALGHGLRVVAHAPDGVVEGIELDDPDRWVVGVQWHPEDTADTDASQQGLFDAFVTEAATRSR
ncbi:MAG: gamma-glutamyl-gamma-aminobutyrate hydrolase family protein [Actinobacteria bacterium]|nr:gamma-glutamyl-gamma-aminobutyrate hydrolase family protein [Actinomycetota bacterium]